MSFILYTFYMAKIYTNVDIVFRDPMIILGASFSISNECRQHLYRRLIENNRISLKMCYAHFLILKMS